MRSAGAARSAAWCWAAWVLLAALAIGGCAAAPKIAQVKGDGARIPRLKTWALEGEIHLDWDFVRGAAAYNLYWSDDPDVASSRDNKIAGLKGTSYIHKGLRNGETYYYFLVATDAAGNETLAFPETVDVPFRYDVRRFRNFLAVLPRVHDTFDSLAQQYLQDADKGWLIRDFNDLRRVTPFQAVLIPLKPYEPGGLTSKGYRTVPVLTYHHISRTRASKMAVPVTSFELQMAYLRRNRYQVIPLRQLIDFLEFKGQVPERAVVITFDDGWASTYRLAYPILRRYGYQATLFLSTDVIGSSRRALTWKQARELAASETFDVQCHTKSHRNLKMQPEEDFRGYMAMLQRELRDSRALVKRKTGKECQFLAYPYGATNHLVVAMAQKFGYRAAFTVDRGANPFFVSNYRILRSMIFGDYDLQQFAANLADFSDRVLK